ncbi:MAG TPA: AEC family transporter, partial [Candidatus Marinimicrobia bacterium]|nr:AEC family transporter [Candidatus Neomarinimicrobiota bacterium]
MENLIFAFNSIAPVFFIVFMGIFLKRIKLIDDHFVKVSSQLVFKVTIPALIFINIAKADFGQAFQGKMILFALLVIGLSFLLIFILTFPIENMRLRGAFIQSAFRSNYAILGLALLMNLYGA